MKLFPLAFALILSSFFSCANGSDLGSFLDDELKLYGAVEFTNSEFNKELMIRGSFNVNKIKVNEEAKIYGSAMINSSNFEKLKIMGNADLKNSQVKQLEVRGSASLFKSSVKDTVKVFGFFQSQESSFGKNLKIYSNSVKLQDTSVKNNIMISNSKNETILYFNGKSNIGGQIIFNGVPGKVLTDNKDNLKGLKVKNGKIELTKE